MAAYTDAAGHLFAEMKRIDLLLRRAVLLARQHRSAEVPDDFRGLAVFEPEIDTLLASDDLLEQPWQVAGDVRDDISAMGQQIAAMRQTIDQDVGETIRQGETPRLVRLAATCGLRPAEVDLLLVALAPELDPRYEMIFAYLQNDVTRRRPSVDLALNLIVTSASEKVRVRILLSQLSPLLRYSLLSMDEETMDRTPSLLRRWLRPGPGVVSFLLAAAPESVPGVRVRQVDLQPIDIECSQASRLQFDNLLSTLERTGLEHALIHLTAERPNAAVVAARALAQALLRPLLEVKMEKLAQSPDDAALWWRDTALWNGILAAVQESSDAPDAEPGRDNPLEDRLWNGYEAAPAPAILVGSGFSTGKFPLGARVFPLHLDAPENTAQRDTWAAALAQHQGPFDLLRLGEAFPLERSSVDRIVSIAEAYAALRNPSAPEVATSDLLRAGRSLNTPRLSQFATSINPRFDMDDIILPPVQKAQLQRVAGRLRNRALVMQEWGFGNKMSRGRGLSILFTGAPGVGKTMAAEVLARLLDLRLFQIDLPSVVSKYIGETTRNLSEIFREAEMTQSLLFFDEADALFGRRTEVKEANDRYSNIEINYLLQRLEVYEGPVILSTNFKKNLDEAFLRRLHEMIEFPMPDEEQRLQIWQSHLPAQAPVGELDLAFVARQFPLSGGNIRNALLGAAFLAADAGQPIGMEHILPSIEQEMLKQGRLVMKSDMGAYSRQATGVR